MKSKSWIRLLLDRVIYWKMVLMFVFLFLRSIKWWGRNQKLLLVIKFHLARIEIIKRLKRTKIVCIRRKETILFIRRNLVRSLKKITLKHKGKFRIWVIVITNFYLLRSPKLSVKSKRLDQGSTQLLLLLNWGINQRQSWQLSLSFHQPGKSNQK